VVEAVRGGKAVEKAGEKAGESGRLPHCVGLLRPHCAHKCKIRNKSFAKGVYRLPSVAASEVRCRLPSKALVAPICPNAPRITRGMLATEVTDSGYVTDLKYAGKWVTASLFP